MIVLSYGAVKILLSRKWSLFLLPSPFPCIGTLPYFFKTYCLFYKTAFSSNISYRGNTGFTMPDHLIPAGNAVSVSADQIKEALIFSEAYWLHQLFGSQVRSVTEMQLQTDFKWSGFN